MVAAGGTGRDALTCPRHPYQLQSAESAQPRQSTMRASRYTEEQVIGFIKQADASVTVADLCRKEGFGTARLRLGGLGTRQLAAPTTASAGRPGHEPEDRRTDP